MKHFKVMRTMMALMLGLLAFTGCKVKTDTGIGPVPNWEATKVFDCQTCQHPERFIFEDATLWENGTTITYAFRDTDNEVLTKQMAQRIEALGSWIGLKFVRGSDANWQDAMMRIGFEDSGAWSFVGTGTQRISKTSININIGFTELGRVIINGEQVITYRVEDHELFHFIGVSHEHFNAAIVEELDEGKTIDWCASFGWSEQTCRWNLLRKPSDGFTFSVADGGSIMIYSIPCKVFKNPESEFCERFNLYYSSGDSLFGKRFYPRNCTIDVTDDIKHETCNRFNTSDGSISLTYAGVDCTWENGHVGKELEGISAGEYRVTVTNGKSGCTAAKVYTVGDKNDCDADAEVNKLIGILNEKDKRIKELQEQCKGNADCERLVAGIRQLLR